MIFHPGWILMRLWQLYPPTAIKYQNDWLKYDHRVMYKKYTTSLPFYGMWGSRKTPRDGPANKKTFSTVSLVVKPP